MKERNNLPKQGTPVQGDDGKSLASERQRIMLAEFCRTLRDPKGKSSRSPVSGGVAIPKMAPRLKQTLELLLAGDAEKQIALKLKLSPHTIHDYVKNVYRRFGVGSRAELLALWVRK